MNAFRASTSSGSRVATSVCLGIGLVLFAASQAVAAARFRESSLFGTFAAVGIGDDHVSASVGTVTYDGAGNVRRSLLVNTPDGNGGRLLLAFQSEGTYEVRPDGTGVARVTSRASNGSVNEVTFDFVIQETQPNGRAGQRRATKLFSVQREPGTSVSLVTTSETLIAP
jgi:hypothetical protein